MTDPVYWEHLVSIPFEILLFAAAVGWVIRFGWGLVRGLVR
jgi:hypothetical protein